MYVDNLMIIERQKYKKQKEKTLLLYKYLPQKTYLNQFTLKKS